MGVGVPIHRALPYSPAPTLLTSVLKQMERGRRHKARAAQHRSDDTTGSTGAKNTPHKDPGVVKGARKVKKPERGSAEVACSGSGLFLSRHAYLIHSHVLRALEVGLYEKGVYTREYPGNSSITHLSRRDKRVLDG